MTVVDEVNEIIREAWEMSTLGLEEAVSGELPKPTLWNRIELYDRMMAAFMRAVRLLAEEMDR